MQRGSLSPRIATFPLDCSVNEQYHPGVVPDRRRDVDISALNAVPGFLLGLRRCQGLRANVEGLGAGQRGKVFADRRRLKGKAMDTKIFLDCLGREIKVGDVLANGHRDGNCGGISVGVVTGFKDGKILATKYVRGDWCEYDYDGSRQRSWWANDTGKTWRPYKGHWSYGERCCITGMTEADLRQIVGLSESEEAPCGIGSD